MKILQINTVLYGSTGKIVHDIQTYCEENEVICRSACRYHEKKAFSEDYRISSWLNCHIHNRISRYTMLQGCFSILHTMVFLRRISKFHPDIIHLHNLHGSYINLPILFHYIKKHNIKIVWTLHDCWSFTGYCPHFTITQCERWKTGCYNCPDLKEGSKVLIDLTRFMWRMKYKWFVGVKNMTIVTPSLWLSDLVKQSFLKEYPIKVINNGIDLKIFQPSKSDFRKRYGIQEEKSIILGVAFGWEERKGLDIFLELAKRLSQDKYQIVLVGTDERVDQLLSKEIISIHRTHNQVELSEIYTVADVFVNPTREDNYPTVNMESLACGTPVITFCTGGSPEMLDESCGCVIPVDDVDAMEKMVIRVCETKPYSVEACLLKARNFEKEKRYKEYFDLYKELINE